MSENLEKEISVDIAKPQKILKEKKYKKLDQRKCPSIAIYQLKIYFLPPAYSFLYI